MFSLLKITIALSLTIAVARPEPTRQVRSPDVESLLSHLVGEWRMDGSVRGQPVVYDLHSSRVLNGKFVELHMVDSGGPARYEARVFIGADTAAGHIIAHWLDGFGAAYSLPAGFGSMNGDTLTVEFAYPTGAFRDTFIYDRRDDSWDISLLVRGPDGAWRPFAHYAARRSTTLVRGGAS